mmetsp:Transcript_21042/g.62964  ORF Transcript_21042/g.62964 Transcript_21042/m.62964 type:complete len:204 (-) Transcript_21042:106-717(-)
MLRRAAESLLRPQLGALAGVANGASASQLLAAARYSNTVPDDYSLVMHKAAEVTNAAVTRTDTAQIGKCAGVPMETYKRPVRIYVSSRSSSQQGMGKTLSRSSFAPQWRIAFDTTQKWENHLMGWTSTADPLENVGRAALFFYTKEEAMAFADKHGWKFTVDEPNLPKTTRQKRFNSYGDNFSTKRKGLPDMSYTAVHATYEK